MKPGMRQALTITASAVLFSSRGPSGVGPEVRFHYMSPLNAAQCRVTVNALGTVAKRSGQDDAFPPEAASARSQTLTANRYLLRM